VLAELAIAAGIAGHSITLYHDGYPAPHVCGLWRHFSNLVGPDRTFQVSSHADTRKLAGSVSELRLVLVHEPRFLNPTAWTVQMADPAVESVPRPAVFCRFAPTDPESDPGPSLVLRANPRECTLTQQWLLAGHLGRLGLADIEPEPNGVVTQLDPVLSTTLSTDGIAPRRFRDRQVLLGLLAGACLLRCVPRDDVLNASLTVNLQDYELVRGILQSPILGSADDGFNPLAADMVSRSNVYISVKHGAGQDGQSRFPEEGPSIQIDIRGERPPRELITRREVADLGNSRSRTVRRLIAFLQQQADGYQRFRHLGLVRRPPDREAWRRAEVSDLIACLRPWTYKQVRTHFDLLCKAGMITAKREQTNGPWRYALPQELTSRPTAFRGLPTVQEITGGGQAA
jgi:hypothetical protein